MSRASLRFGSIAVAISAIASFSMSAMAAFSVTGNGTLIATPTTPITITSLTQRP